MPPTGVDSPGHAEASPLPPASPEISKEAVSDFSSPAPISATVRPPTGPVRFISSQGLSSSGEKLTFRKRMIKGLELVPDPLGDHQRHLEDSIAWYRYSSKWLLSRQRPLKKVWIPGGTIREVMTGKPPEGTRGSGQPTVLYVVGARTAVVLLRMAEVVLMEDVLFVASRVIGRKSVLLACRNLLFLNRRRASQVLFLIRTLRKCHNSHRVLCRLLLPLSLISISTTLRVILRTFRLLRPQGVKVGMDMAVLVQDPAAADLVKGEVTKGKER
ncbi:hypothetical protein PanWU01x14_030380 [Parasponia andersonii]|uniref:Uncharacterized protein n=1 Tax=Parasponia andersonii TaxID=3476 RepID=A0A2P5DUV1_PARAD|nr:hypothetical protein PanWU01x14_030380 [Parasponia andersonii]